MLPQILAPTNEAFDALARALNGGKKMAKEKLFQLPELKDILQYHIVPGRYTTGMDGSLLRRVLLTCRPPYYILSETVVLSICHTEALFNNTPVFTAMGVAFTPFNDPCMTEGAVMLHDNW